MVHRRPRRFQIRFRAAEDLFLREIGIEREPQLVAELVVAEAEVSVGARKQILLEPLLVVGERSQRGRLRRTKFPLQRRRVLRQRLELLFDELHGPLVLLDGSVGVHFRRRL